MPVGCSPYRCRLFIVLLLVGLPSVTMTQAQDGKVGKSESTKEKEKGTKGQAAKDGKKKEEEKVVPPTAEEIAALTKTRDELHAEILLLEKRPELQTRDGLGLLADVRVFEKAATWMLRYKEFHRNDYAKQLQGVLKSGADRAKQLSEGKPGWNLQQGTTVRGFTSTIDGSIQPYAITLPAGVDPGSGKRWPLHLVLHGRADQMNEVNFIHRMDGKMPKKDSPEATADWIQLDVYGRGNNAYRWAGETDVFEALADVKRRFRIDDNRITLHGFSMGGAGAWHLGMHHPHLWSSVGPGAGFVDFYAYQKKNPSNPADRLPFAQDKTLRIYDTVNYALNAFNVPTCTYGGENDPQLLASTTMAEAAKKQGVDIKVIVGPGMGHAFDPQSQKDFMAFHLEKSAKGRPKFGERREIRFETRTLKYSTCDWITIEEMVTTYEPTSVRAKVNDQSNVEVQTQNVSAFRLARDIAEKAIIDGVELECRSAADGLLPDVYFVRTGETWRVLSYAESKRFSDNRETRKRPGLQGPIDDAFASRFVCVVGSSKGSSETGALWSEQTLETMKNEFSQWMRGDVQVIRDSELTPEIIESANLILFGDPASNRVIRDILPELPVQWTADKLTVSDRDWSTSDHGLCMIYPNPLNRRRYVVINSGHTFHEKDFRSSNAWLFPRLGDVAVMKIETDEKGQITSTPVWSDVFDSSWKLPNTLR